MAIIWIQNFTFVVFSLYHARYLFAKNIHNMKVITALNIIQKKLL